MNNTSGVRFRRPVLVFLGMALLLLCAVIFFGIFQYEKHEYKREMRKQLLSVESLLTHYIESEQAHLGAFIEIITNDTSLQQAYLAGSREVLLKDASPFFSRLLAEHDISHFYFVKPDRTCFLRIHNPESYGDVIDHYTMKQAALSGKPAYGLEIGNHGTLTLRVVYPWIVENNRIGFVELGREIEYITPVLKNILGVELFFLVNKELLDREEWQQSMEKRGRGGNWDELPHHVIVEQTLPAFPEITKDEVSLSAETQLFNVQLEGKSYEGGTIPLLDAGGRTVGNIVTLADSTEREVEESKIVLLLVSCVSLLVVGLFFFYGYMGRLEAGLKKAYGRLEEEVESRKTIEKELREYEGHLEQLVANRTARLQESTDSLREEMAERKGVEKKLLQAREEWENSFNAIGDIITIQDVEMTIIQANRAAHVFFAGVAGGIIGKKCHEIFRGQATPCADCPSTKIHFDKGSHTEIISHEMLGKIFSVTYAPVVNADGELQYLVHVARDITQQKKLEEDLRQAQKMEAIGTLAGGIAHDFNNILSAIMGYCELAKQHLPPETAMAAREDIEQVIRSGQRAGSLVKQILDFSRKTEQSLQSLQPHLIVDEALKLLRSTLPSSVEIVSDLDPASGVILADPTTFYQIVMNLCTNGFHALKDEYGTLRVTLSRQQRAVEDSAGGSGEPVHFVVLSVSDTGQGMDAETVDHIFEPYFTTREQGKGTGLGLAVVHSIVKGYDGFIEVESEPGQGSTFRVFIPALGNGSLIPEQSEQRVKQAGTLPLGTERILIVDDEPLLVLINQRLLETYGYTVTGVTDSREALAKVQADPTQFDLIVSDQTMPGLTGSELASAVLAIAPLMPIIICTGHSATVSAKDAYAMGIRKYLYKPVEGDALAGTVRMVLDEQERNPEG